MEVERKKVGKVFNSMDKTFEGLEPVKESVEIVFPARLNAMALDPSKVELNEDNIYTPGELVFSVKLYTRVKAKIIDEPEVRVGDDCPRKALLKHSASIMRQELGLEKGIYVEAYNEHGIKHAGLGSSGGINAGVVSAINYLYGEPVSKQELIKFIAQNHGEEIDGDDDHIIPVQCIGGSASSGMLNFNTIMLAGESCVVKTANIEGEYSVIIGLPKDFESPDAEKALKKEAENMEGFVECGEKHGEEIAYRVLHDVLPAMEKNELGPVGDLVFDYRFDMGSNDNCAFMYPRLKEITRNIRFLHEEGYADALAVSSVGPGVFAITKNPEKCRKVFEEQDLKIVETELEPSSFRVVEES